MQTLKPQTPEEREQLVEFVAGMARSATNNGVNMLLRQMLSRSGNSGPAIHESLVSAFLMGVVFALKSESELHVDLRPLLLTGLSETLVLKKVVNEKPTG